MNSDNRFGKFRKNYVGKVKELCFYHILKLRYGSLNLAPFILLWNYDVRDYQKVSFWISFLLFDVLMWRWKLCHHYHQLQLFHDFHMSALLQLIWPPLLGKDIFVSLEISLSYKSFDNIASMLGRLRVLRQDVVFDPLPQVSQWNRMHENGHYKWSYTCWESISLFELHEPICVIVLVQGKSMKWYSRTSFRSVCATYCSTWIDHCEQLIWCNLMNVFSCSTILDSICANFKEPYLRFKMW